MRKKLTVRTTISIVLFTFAFETADDESVCFTSILHSEILPK